MRTGGFSFFSVPRLRVETFHDYLARPFPPRPSFTTDKGKPFQPSVNLQLKLLNVRPLAPLPPTLPAIRVKTAGHRPSVMIFVLAAIETQIAPQKVI